MRRLRYASKTIVVLFAACVLSVAVSSNRAFALSVTTTTMASVSSTGEPANGFASYMPTMTPDGRYVTFTSDATNLAPGTSDQYSQVYLRDMQTNTTVLISQSPSGEVANRNGRALGISSDGRYVLFYSEATNLLPGIEPALPYGYTYLFDNQTHSLTGVCSTLGPTSLEGPMMSSDANIIAYPQFDANNQYSIFVLNRSTGVTTEVGPTDQGIVRVSTDGSSVMYTTDRHTYDYYETYDLMNYHTITGTTEKTLDDVSMNTWQVSPTNTLLAYTSRNDENRLGVRIIDLTSKQEVRTIFPTDLVAPESIAFSGNNKYFSYMEHTAENSGPSFGKLWVENLSTQERITLKENAHRHTSLQFNPDGSKLVYADTATDRQTYVVGLTEDTVPPTVGSPQMSPTVMLFTHNATVSVNASDVGTGVARGEYYIGNDPGQGNGISLPYANGKVSDSVTISGINPGVHRLYIRAVDNAGNWSTPVSVQFVYVNLN